MADRMRTEDNDRAGTDATVPAVLRLEHLRAIARSKGFLTIQEILEAAGSAGIGLTILFLAIPALTPIPGPFGMAFGTALALVSVQMTAGKQRLWLPSVIGKRRLSTDTIDFLVSHCHRMSTRVGKITQTGRLPGFSDRRAERLLGFPVFLLAVVVALPIPFGNILPVISLAILAVALLQRDGLIVLLGLVLSVVTLSATFAFVYGMSAVIANMSAL